MVHLLTKWLLNALALLLAAYLVPGIHVNGLYVALIATLLLGVLNTIVKPILIILTLPINILTLGLFTFVINGLLFWFLGTFVAGFYVDNFLSAVMGAFIVSVISSLGGKFLNH
jgi:putative membrane protein